jgi:DNA-directed RNA polymerase subunit K/omega
MLRITFFISRYTNKYLLVLILGRNNLNINSGFPTLIIDWLSRLGMIARFAQTIIAQETE